MKLGEIYVWVTDQAFGHQVRRKYHIYLCEAGWRTQGHAFLFISSADYGGDYPIRNADYGFLKNEVSYVSCGNIVTYSDDEVAAAKPEKVGSLSLGHLKDLYQAVAASETMEQWQIDLVCKALKPALS